MMNKKTKTQMDALSGSYGYIYINRRVLTRFGPEKALYISNLVNVFKQFYENDELKDNEWFYTTHDEQIKNCCLSSKNKLMRLKKEFVNLEILKTKRIGIPSKEYYKIDFEKLEELLDEV